jgi:hypothetical protein
MNSDEQADHANCASRVRGIQRYHMDTNHWLDIAYNFLICKHGYVFEGRGWGIRSSATGNANSYTLACCFLGDDTVARDDLTYLGRAAMVDVGREFVRRYGLDGSILTTFNGHRNYMSTSCPGDQIMTYINSAAFQAAITGVDPTKRLATLRAWILKQRAAGMSWTELKNTANWREFVRLGGK